MLTSTIIAFDKYRYRLAIRDLVRVRRTGSCIPKDLKGGDVVLPLEQLRNALQPAMDFNRECHPTSSTEREYKYEEDPMYESDEDDDEETKEAKATWRYLERARRVLPPDEERRFLIEEIFQKYRVRRFQSENDVGKFHGLAPWYIMTQEELDMVGIFLPYDLVSHPDHQFVKEAIESEGRRIKELKAAGLEVQSWSEWKKRKDEG